jgi:YggT family protein
VNALSCQVAGWLGLLLSFYVWVLIAYAILSWIPDLQRYQRYLDPFVAPVLNPLRRIIPPMGGLDLSFIVLILLIQFAIRPLLAQLAFNVCFR